MPYTVKGLLETAAGVLHTVRESPRHCQHVYETLLEGVLYTVTGVVDTEYSRVVDTVTGVFVHCREGNRHCRCVENILLWGVLGFVTGLNRHCRAW